MPTHIEGHAIVATENEDEEILLLSNETLGIGLFPHAAIESGESWLSRACKDVFGLTGEDVSAEGIHAVRTVLHDVDGESQSAETHRIVFAATPTGGQIQDCKHSGTAGIDDWEAAWDSSLPDGTSPPEPGAQNDLALVFD